MSRARTMIVLALAVASVGGPAASAGTPATWRHALAARSTAMNREHHLGRFAVPASAATATKPAWLKALEARGQAMNQHYRLGTYAAPRHRVDVKLYVALAGLGAVLLAAIALAMRTTRPTDHRVPESA